jgi:hypothetical protein
MPKQSKSPRAPAPVVNKQRGSTPWTGRANYTTLDEIPTGEEVLAGMFFIMNVLLSFYLIMEHLMTL